MRNKLIEDKDYSYIDIEGVENVGVKLLRSPYENISYVYNTVQFEEDGENGKLNINFDIHNHGDFTNEELSSDVEFKNLVGDILVEILMNGAIKTNEQTGKDNTEESDLQ